jgi:DUF971 family protein
MADAHVAWPTEIKVQDAGRLLKVSFDDGQSFALPAEYLRVMSPSAEVQGHSRKERKAVGGKRNVAVIGVDPIGTYAVKLSFDDLHATGIYTWAYLHQLGCAQSAKWAAYLADLEAKGLSRDRPGEASVG